MRYLKALVLLSSLVLVFSFSSGCKLVKVEKHEPDNAVARVNGEQITEDDLYLVLEGGHGGGQAPGARERAIENLIDQELLYQQGLKLGLDRDPKYRNMVRIMQMRVKEFKRAELARRVASTRIAASVNITEEDARTYYRQNEQQILTDYRLLVLQLPDGEAAGQVQQKLQQGVAFETAGAAYASRAGRESPWDTGFLHWNQVPAEWCRALSTLKPGETSGVVDSPRTGVCILKLIAVKRNDQAAFENMSASIMNRLRDIRIREAYDQYLSNLKKEAKITKKQ